MVDFTLDVSVFRNNFKIKLFDNFQKVVIVLAAQRVIRLIIEMSINEKNGELNDKNDDDWSVDTKDYNLVVPSFVRLFVIRRIIAKSTHNLNTKHNTNKL